MRIQPNLRANLILIIITCFITTHHSLSQNPDKVIQPDVLNYHVQLAPNILEKYIEGNVVINFSIDPSAAKVVFDCGDLHITNINGSTVGNYKQEETKVIISLLDRLTSENEIQIFYEGNPTKGVVFISEPQQMHTVFSTSEWMVCNKSPSDRAYINIDLLVDDDYTTIASGELIKKNKTEANKIMYSWKQAYATPAYTYGFVIGTFNKDSQLYARALNYYSADHTPEELRKIFIKTHDMLLFFENKSGVPYNQKTYSQVLVGNHFQEMSGFSVLKNSYGKLVLEDSTETNLISHELAHQWWGNMITCQNWENIWLNEGLATFMSAAYNEHGFGEAKYLANINAYRKVYEQIKDKGLDKPLVFDSWSNPTSEDRNLVYFKGAYVLHLLREEIGDQEFWKGIKYYSQQNYGKSVTTEEFKAALEESTKKQLTEFFNQWVY